MALTNSTGDQILAAMHTVIAAGRVPGLVLALRRGDAAVEHYIVGSDAAGVPLTNDSLFIIASITKMATALVLLRLIDQRQLALDDALADHLPLAAAAQPGVTIRSLLCHTSGVPLDISAKYAPYTPSLTAAQLAEATLLTPLEAAPWTRVQYSNTGYGLLAQIAETRSDRPFAELLRQHVLEPLGIEGYFGVEPPRPVALLADVRGDRSRDPQIEPFNSGFYRSLGLPWAGLMTTADGALKIVRSFAGEPAGFLSESLRHEATSDQTRGLAGGFVPPLMWNPCPWGLGPELRGTKVPHWAPPTAAPTSFGHSGASGCLAWHDPLRQLSWALLGTRTAESGWLLRRGVEVARAMYE